jgi:hypothetical protein
MNKIKNFFPPKLTEKLRNRKIGGKGKEKYISKKSED